MIINLKNSQGKTRECPTGFSWTNLFLGCLVPLYRSDFKWGVIQFIVALFTGGLSWLVFPFLYNKLYIKDLLKDGYEPVLDCDREYLVNNNFM